MCGKPTDDENEEKSGIALELWMLSFIVIVAYLMIMHQKNCLKLNYNKWKAVSSNLVVYSVL